MTVAMLLANTVESCKRYAARSAPQKVSVQKDSHLCSFATDCLYYSECFDCVVLFLCHVCYISCWTFHSLCPGQSFRLMIHEERPNAGEATTKNGIVNEVPGFV